MAIIENEVIIPQLYSEWRTDVINFLRSLVYELRDHKHKLTTGCTVKDLLSIFQSVKVRVDKIKQLLNSPFLSRLESDLQNEISPLFSITSKLQELDQYHQQLELLINKKFFDPNEPPPPNGLSLRDKYFDASGNPKLVNPDLTDRMIDPADFTDIVNLMTSYGI